MIPQKKHPSPWNNIHGVLRGSMSTDESFGTFIPGAPNDFFLYNLLEGANIA